MVRLGYACINTVLRAKSIYTNRTLRLAKVKEQGIEVAKELGLKNIKDLIPIINLNEKNGIRFFRISSCIFPFASEPEYGYSLQYAAKELKEAGDLAKKYGHRLTTHPGQYNVLCSPTEKVVVNTIRDLSYHAEMLDLMGMGPESVMIIHMGGAYGDKEKSIARFEQNFMRLPLNVRNRIVLENDEISYKVEELLPVCKKLKIPLVLDWHHDRLNPSKNPIQSYLPEIDAIWKERGIKPKQHYSESAKGHPNPRTHSDYISRLPPCAPDMDLMIEAKMKDQTVLRICRKYGIVPDSKVYPTNEPSALSDDDELENKNVTLLGQARKKHNWKKPSTKIEGAEGEEGEEKPKKKRQRKTKEAKDDDGTVTVKKETKKRVTKKKTKEGEVIEEETTEEVTKKKRKKAAASSCCSDDEHDDSDFAEDSKPKKSKTCSKSPAKNSKSTAKSSKSPAKNSKKAKTEEVSPKKVAKVSKKLQDSKIEEDDNNDNAAADADPSMVKVVVEVAKEDMMDDDMDKENRIAARRSPRLKAAQ